MRIKAGVPDAQYYVIHDIENDCKLDQVTTADDQTGEYSQYVEAEEEEGKFVLEDFSGNIKIIDVRLLPENKELLERIDPDGWYWEKAMEEK